VIYQAVFKKCPRDFIHRTPNVVRNVQDGLMQSQKEYPGTWLPAPDVLSPISIALFPWFGSRDKI
jgi:hypothetical protein